MEGHHLILGRITDYITGETLVDTHDERYRQKLARWLVDTLGYRKAEISPRKKITVTVGGKIGSVMVDIAVIIGGKIPMIVKYGAGSLITRHRLTLALARLVAPYQVPLALITNGRDADLLDVASGNVISSGLGTIPAKADLVDRAKDFTYAPVSRKRAEMERRILYAFEIDDNCVCNLADGITRGKP
jgi:hypothetical protein